jgi:hypothetical protein
MKTIPIIALCLIFSASFAISSPKPYSVDRYSAIWHGSYVFEKSTRKASGSLTGEEWTVAGVFSFGTDEGAIVLNRDNGSIEYLSTTSPSPSGMTLHQVIPIEAGQTPRITVTLKGKLLTLSGSVSETPVSEGVSLKYIPSAIDPAAASSIALSEKDIRTRTSDPSAPSMASNGKVFRMRVEKHSISF